jgi:hypothetical protein
MSTPVIRVVKASPQTSKTDRAYYVVTIRFISVADPAWTYDSCWWKYYPDTGTLGWPSSKGRGKDAKGRQRPFTQLGIPSPKCFKAIAEAVAMYFSYLPSAIMPDPEVIDDELEPEDDFDLADLTDEILRGER